MLLSVSSCLAAPEPLPCLNPSQATETVIGLAVSGGGSLAPLFAAGTFARLARVKLKADAAPVLDQVSYISSVSGTSLPSALVCAQETGL